jgi:hypothetical protein
MKGHIATGTVEGTGAAINVELGFTPSRVELRNIDGLAELNWTTSDGDGNGTKRITDGTMSNLSSGGVSAYAGSLGANSAGFTIGADTDVNASGETINWTAFGPDE